MPLDPKALDHDLNRLLLAKMAEYRDNATDYRDGICDGIDYALQLVDLHIANGTVDLDAFLQAIKG